MNRFAERMRNALDGAPRGECRTCHNPIALVDTTTANRGKFKGIRRGGKWVHVDLPESSIHPAHPEKV